MIFKCLGYRPPFDYTDKKTQQLKRGAEFHGARVPNSREHDVVGCVVKAVWLGMNDIALIPLGGFEVGKSYEFKYDTDGRFTFLSSISEVKKDEKTA